MVMSNMASRGSAPNAQHATSLSPPLKAASGYVAAHDTNSRAQSTAKNAIVIIDPQVFSRECLARVLGQECGASIECYSSIEEWIGAGEPTTAGLVVLCQSGLSRADIHQGVARLAEVSEQIRGCPAVILSDNEDPDLIVQMLGKNVRGYVPTSLSIQVVVQAIELARAGGVFVPASSLIASHRAPDRGQTAVQKPNGLFTARQVAVVDALRRGKANKIIAYELKMRESTVKVHVRNIMKKLHATNRTEVAYMASQLFNGEEYVG